MGAESGSAFWSFGTCGATSSLAMDGPLWVWNWGWNEKLGWKQDTRGRKRKKKRGDQTSFLPTQVTSRGGFTPNFGFALPVYLYCCSFSSWKARHCQNKILQIFWIDSQFHEKQYPTWRSPDSNWVSLLCSIPSQLRSGVADYVIFLTILYDIIFEWWLYTHNLPLIVEHGFYFFIFSNTWIWHPRP